MTRRAARVDANHAEIVDALRRAGCAVLDLSAVGKGCPDLLVAVGGKQQLIEIKRPKAKGQRAGELTPDQREFIAQWPASIAVVDSAERALQAMGLQK